MMEVESASSPEVEIVEDTNGQKSSTDVKKRGTKKRKKKGANEPQKPVSAYALFFRDTQAAIKQENPSATFGEISKIVASMWDSLSEDAKLVYKRKTETAKRDYLKQLAAYRANLVSRGGLDVDEEDSTPLSVLKLKMTDQRSSPNLHQDLPPPPKLQMAPTVVRGIQIQHQAGCTPLDVPLEPNSASIVSGSDESRDSQPITSAETSPSIPVQHIILRSVPAPNLPPIQLRNIVPKPLPTVTLLQSKPGQVIKLLPSSQPANVAENNVQPILQTLAQEHETCLQDEDFPMNNGVQHPGEVPSASQPAVTTVASIHPNNDTSSSSVRICKRDGCLNPAVSDPQWNEEYCSSECVVYHCRDVFDAWASVRQVSASVI